MIPSSDFVSRAKDFYRKPSSDGKALEGFPGLTYQIEGSKNPYSGAANGNLRLNIFDGETQVAESSASPNSYNFPLKCHQISTIKVSPAYQGKGLASKMYQLWLNMGPVLSDEYQTPNGRKMWSALYNKPNVAVKGYFLLPTDSTDSKLIDNIMERGGQYLGVTRGNAHCFLYDVVPGKTNLQAFVNPTKNPLYTLSIISITGTLTGC